MRTEDGRIEQQKARARQLDEGDERGEGRDDIWPGAVGHPAGRGWQASWRSPCDLICQRHSLTASVCFARSHPALCRDALPTTRICATTSFSSALRRSLTHLNWSAPGLLLRIPENPGTCALCSPETALRRSFARCSAKPVTSTFLSLRPVNGTQSCASRRAPRPLRSHSVHLPVRSIHVSARLRRLLPAPSAVSSARAPAVT